MAHGIKKHLKRLKAPKKWGLSKLGGIFSIKPNTGPHAIQNSYPLALVLKNKLKYAINNREVSQILFQKNITIDEKIRTNGNYPMGIMDILKIKKTGENFRLLHDSIGRFVLHRITRKESLFKLCKVIKINSGKMGIPYIITHDGRTIRYPNPNIKKNDSVLFNIFESKIIDFIKLDVGSLCIVTGGCNVGKIGIIQYKEKVHQNGETVYIKNLVGNQFSTKISNIFVIGKGNKSFISLPRNKALD